MRQGGQDSREERRREEIGMIPYVVLCAVAVLGAAIVAALRQARPISVAVGFRAVAASGLAAAGVLVSIFVADGFGWGWPDLSRSQIMELRLLAGLGMGLAIGIAAWLTSRRFRLGWLCLSLVLNALIALIPPQQQAVRLLFFTTATFLTILGWNEWRSTRVE